MEQMNDTFWKTSEVRLFDLGCLCGFEIAKIREQRVLKVRQTELQSNDAITSAHFQYRLRPARMYLARHANQSSLAARLPPSPQWGTAMLQDLQEQPFKAAAGPPGALFTQRFANSRLRLTTLVLRRQVGSRFIAAGASAAAAVTAVTGTVCCCSVGGACCRCCAVRATGVLLPQSSASCMPQCAWLSLRRSCSTSAPQSTTLRASRRQARVAQLQLPVLLSTPQLAPWHCDSSAVSAAAAAGGATALRHLCTPAKLRRHTSLSAGSHHFAHHCVSIRHNPPHPRGGPQGHRPLCLCKHGECAGAAR